MINILSSIKLASKAISKELKKEALKPTLTKINKIYNKTGDLVKQIDIIANDIFIDHLSPVECVAKLYSEEEEFEIDFNRDGYTVAFDPLDGSNGVDTNSPTGSLFCIFKKDQLNGNGIVAAGYTLYSTTTQMVLAIDGTIKVFVLDGFNKFVEIKHDHMVPNCGNYYSHNHHNNHLISNKKDLQFLSTLSQHSSSRYSGCLVADLHLLLFKGGCFCYPANDVNVNGKIRLLYEAYPAAFIIETACGFSRYNGTPESILTQPLLNIHQQTPIFLMTDWEKNLYDYL